jgi:hypothetical protein
VLTFFCSLFFSMYGSRTYVFLFFSRNSALN